MKHYDLTISDEMEMLMRAIMRGATRPITMEELLKRWLAKGLSFDAVRPEEQGETIVRNFVKLQRK
jgi:hypothetical protein